MTNKGKTILIVDDDRTVCQFLSRLAQGEGLVPTTAFEGETALAKVQAECPDVLLVDLRMPGMDGMEVMRRAKAFDEDLPVILITGNAEIKGAVAAMKAGAHDYLAKPFNDLEVKRVILRALSERELKRKLKNLSCEVQQSGSLREILGPSDAVGQLIADINHVAKSDFGVVILGETGAGKEVMARAIHQASLRADKPFVPVDCGAIPETLLEDELFGHEKGAFTSAVSKQGGKFEAAQAGTLFLDEISNMPLGSQAKLLRVLQEKSIYRIGSTKSINVDVRVLVASNQDLKILTDAGTFRRDLYFRLNEFTICIPPLRERRMDIIYLAKRFLDITNVELKKNVSDFSESAIEALLSHSWPGNVRQLRSTVRRAVLLADDIITDKHLDIVQLPNGLPGGGEARALEPQGIPPGDLPLKEIIRRSTMKLEREVLTQALRRTAGNKAKAARLLQIDYKTMHTKVKEYGINLSAKEEYGQED
jgi:two-component system nitrogen regulation response regulator GlnG